MVIADNNPNGQTKAEGDEEKDAEDDIRHTGKNDKFESYLKGAVATPLVGLPNAGAHTKELKAYLNKRFPNNNEKQFAENENYSASMCSEGAMLPKINQPGVDLPQSKGRLRQPQNFEIEGI